MNIEPYELSATRDLLTSRSGLMTIAELMQGIGFSDRVNKYFPVSRSNRGFDASVFTNTVMLMLHDGAHCLDDIEHIRTDSALRKLMGLEQVLAPNSLGDWLRRMGTEGACAVKKVNRKLLKLVLGNCRKVTLDILDSATARYNDGVDWATTRTMTGGHTFWIPAYAGMTVRF